MKANTISYNEWVCPTCKGCGLDPEKMLTKEENKV